MTIEQSLQRGQPRAGLGRRQYPRPRAVLLPGWIAALGLRNLFNVAPPGRREAPIRQYP